MFKRRLPFAICLILLFLATLSAQQVKPIDRDSILGASESILKEVSELRGLPAKNSVKSGFKTRDELSVIIKRDLDEDRTPEQFNSQNRLLTRLGLVPKGFDLREEMRKLLDEQIGGFYEPRSGEFYLIDWLNLDEQRPVIAHELTHALQDQNFNLKRFDKFPKDEGDQEMAIRSLIEGEATVVMFNYIFKPQGLDVTRFPVPLSTVIDMMNKEGNDDNDARFPVLSAAPPAVKESLEFPYFFGAAFVQQIVGKTSWSKIADLYNGQLIESTEQILHPEKALNLEHPVKIKLGDLSEKLGKGWRKSDINVDGEFGLYLILKQYLGKDRARAAAAGWGGDRYVFYDRADNNESIFTQVSTWDTETDANEFFNAYMERTQERYKLDKKLSDTETVKIYTTDEGMALIERRGDRVLVVEGGDEAQLKTLRETIWKQATFDKTTPAKLDAKPETKKVDTKVASK